MELKTFFAQDLSGNVIPSPTVDVFQPGTTTRVTGLQTATGAALSNPFTGTTTGQITLAAPDGTYDLAIAGGGRAITMRVRFVSVTSDGVALAQAAAVECAAMTSIAQAASLASEAARDSTYVIAGVYEDTAEGLTETAEGDQFQVISADGLSFQVFRHDAGPVATPITGAVYSTQEYIIKTAGRLVPQIPGDYLEVLVDAQGRAAMTMKNNGEIEYPISLRAPNMELLSFGGEDSTVRQDLTGTPYENAVEIECDSQSRIRRVLWADGSEDVYLPGGGSSGPSAILQEMTSVPNGAQGQNVIGGFTCTGLTRITTGKYQYCWLVGNDGRSVEGSTVFNCSVVMLAPDFRSIVAEFDMRGISGIQSIQGVVWDSSDSTFWFVDKTNKIIRHYTTAGAPAGGDIAVPAITPNGIAYDPVRDAIFAHNEGTTSVMIYSCADGSLLQTVTGISTSADMLFFDSLKNELWFSAGTNGTDGQARVMPGNGGAVTRIYTLPGSQSIEGIYIDGSALWSANDGAFHVAAKPPLALINRYTLKG